jgi:hypothetical protein
MSEAIKRAKAIPGASKFGTFDSEGNFTMSEDEEVVRLDVTYGTGICQPVHFDYEPCEPDKEEEKTVIIGELLASVIDFILPAIDFVKSIGKVYWLLAGLTIVTVMVFK